MAFRGKDCQKAKVVFCWLGGVKTGPSTALKVPGLAFGDLG
jgi:hypothetical protein